MRRKVTIILSSFLVVLGGCSVFGFLKKDANDKQIGKTSPHLKEIDADKIDWKSKPDAYWKEVLTPVQYEVTRKEGTERAFTGQYWDHKEVGTYTCSNCGQELFSSETKYKSGTGWPSFYKPLNESVVGEKKDTKFGMVRTEVHCSRCKAHLGHVFPDGPQPTGLRYCLNSVSLNFSPKEKSE